ncbi:glycosyltransferase family 9 protein [Leeuwenhoekiella sp. W20_SRS_FM14]|uniref:glycosyltransferase family 9 protein n=1 Tax=Leeuwenhoekiella sp. W20_SRS_FM14 TaxID=3240270 RepID=UPI003F98A4C9
MKKILIVKNKRIGDVLIASIVANNLKKIYPDSHITFLCYDYAAPVLLHNPNIDYIWTLNDKELKKVSNLVQLTREVKQEQFDLIIDLYVKLQSQILCLFSGVKQRIGFSKKVLPFSYTYQVPILKNRLTNYGKAIDDRINILKHLDDKMQFDAYPKLYLTEKELNKGKDLLSKQGFDFNKKSIMIGVLGSDPSKSLPLDYIATLIDWISANYDAQILFNYIPSQKPLVDELLKKVTNTSKLFPDILGSDIREFIIIMNHVDVLIANEGGAVHIAKALNKSTFTIYSPYVNKEHWATFENVSKNESIHLNELKPELFEGLSSSEIKKQTTQLYASFTPEYITPKLEEFLNNNF